MMAWLVSTKVYAVGRARDQTKPLKDVGKIQWRLLEREGVKTEDCRSFAEENSWFNLFSDVNERQFFVQYNYFIVCFPAG